MNLTPAQLQAIHARGNVVVVAGAGTGKTRTLVERALQRLLEDKLSLDEILMVTFTEAAAAEMRQRIRRRLEEEVSARPGEAHLSEQLALLDTAQISTLHSFCLQLVRQHFYELGLDPELTVLPEEQAQVLAADVLDRILAAHYASPSAESKAVLELLQSQCRGWEKSLRDLVAALHRYTQTRPDSERWISEQLAVFQRTDTAAWRIWLLEGFIEWRNLWLPVLRQEQGENPLAAACVTALESTLRQDADPSQLLLFGASATPADTQLILKNPAQARSKFSEALDRIQDARINRPKGKKGGSIESLKQFFQEAEFLGSVARMDEKSDPLTQDWEWVRHHMITLLKLTRQFAQEYLEAKREAAQVDFHDLEQFTLRLLWDSRKNQPTELAERWRQRFQEVFVDEYQDINAAQDRILTALSRTEGDRFIVGDIKQSIYRFRQAEPAIFQKYAALCRARPSTTAAIRLNDNFRSRESILDFINALFGSVMRSELGGIEYDSQAQLRFGDATARQSSLGKDAAPGGPRVQVLLRFSEKAELPPSEEVSEEEVDLAELSDMEKEARLVGQRLLELHRTGYQIWDQEEKCLRPVTWSDMVILLRAPKFKVESYAKEFARLGVPLQAKRSGFFDSSEVSDLLNLLRLLDNPLQDVPVLAVLRSPLVGLTIDELTQVRLAQKKVRFWVALEIWHRQHAVGSDREKASGKSAPSLTASKVERFLDRFRRWRHMARHATLTQRLETILTETHYLDWLLTQPRGSQRQANVHQLLALARDYDALHSQGLYRFLQFIEAQHSTSGDREPAPLETEQAVRLMSIHQSKGLEFPVVVVGDLGKRFNLNEGTGGILLDESFGLCPSVRAPETGQSYPSLPRWLAGQRQRREALGEELRILYVALTRAQDTLILAGTGTRHAPTHWAKKAESAPTTYQLLRSRSYLDWLGPWLTNQVGNPNWTAVAAGTTSLWSWQVDADLGTPSPPSVVPSTPETTPDPGALDQLEQRLLWSYPFSAATKEPAKTSVTALRHRSTIDEEATPAAFARPLPSISQSAGILDSAAIGTAQHRFMQLVNLDKVTSLAGLAEEVHRLGDEKIFTADELKALDPQAVLKFWHSDLGSRILAHRDSLQRELAFTVRITPRDLARLNLLPHSELAEDEFVLAQGTIDLAVLLPDRIWVVELKTDRITKDEVAERTRIYQPQLDLYAFALASIYQRPVTERWLYYFALGQGHSIPAIQQS